MTNTEPSMWRYDNLRAAQAREGFRKVRIQFGHNDEIADYEQSVSPHWVRCESSADKKDCTPDVITLDRTFVRWHVVYDPAVAPRAWGDGGRKRATPVSGEEIPREMHELCRWIEEHANTHAVSQLVIRQLTARYGA